ncbi:TRAP transporter large permease [Salipiger mangrovisoli]|uniref:TRAP transporter large permease protein n=1 Tax=Salipiger mangrovisoli TaxID=2865933 RepID=A0ABR9XA20_9RHOB|nr:TRAP transporter large permease [Salipiger mangrovisoli]MBE9640347.1 TRAP transporter large permease [Salipiger mangrovisoli]
MPIFPFLFLTATLLSGSAIAYFVGGATIVGFFSLDQTRYLAALPQRAMSQLDVFAFLAMPLFILTGELMNRGGVTEALIRFSLSMLGRFKGGMAHVNILTSVFFAGISGSATADAAALGNTLVPEMERQGYSRDYAAAITAASSIIGPIIPPSIILIFYGALLNTSVVALFAAGVVPGLLLAAVLMAVNAFMAHRYDHPGGKGSEIPPFWGSLVQALPALSLPVIILSGILFGVMTPAEAAGVASLAALAVGMFYGRLTLRDVQEALSRTVMLSGAVFIILVAVATFGYLTSVEQLPRKLAEMIGDVGLDATGYMIVLNLIFLAAGMVMDVKAAVALLGPLLIPPAIALGVDPVHMGILIGFNLTVGLLTPPLGGVLLILSTVVDIGYWRLVRACLPFLVVELILLGVLIYVPAISLTLPRYLGLIN